ncbi:MAG: flagellar basal body-associated FliL family protein [Kangiellaceae bacterium]
MANDDADLENDVDGEGGGSGGGSKKLIIIIAVVVLIGGGAAAFFLLGGDSNEEAGEEDTAEEVVEVKEAIYIGVPNAITANLPGEKRSRTVQIKMNFLVRSDEAKTNVKAHMPQLKNDILMLLSQKNADDLKLPEGRQQLQAEALETVQKTLTSLVNDPTVEKVLFVSFVMQ